MKPSEVRIALQTLWSTRWPAFIWGPPGVGKSSVVNQLARERGVEVLDVRAPLLDPTDLRGIPAVVGDRAVWFPPSFLPDADATPGVLFFDELNAAAPIVQASLYQLVLDRRIGEYRLPDGWIIIAAGNREEDGSLVYRMPDALANRFVHLQFEASYDDWKAWAMGRRIHPTIIGLLGIRRELLHKPGGGGAYPTPRSWEMASDVLEAFGTVEAAEEVLVGTIGQAAAVELLALCRDAEIEQIIVEAVVRPTACVIPKQPSRLSVLVSHLVRRLDEAKVREAIGALLSRLPVEFAALLFRDVAKQRPLLTIEKPFREFLKANREILR